MSHLQLILFDLDDTLYDFDDCWQRGMGEALRLHPFTRDLDTDTLLQRFIHYNVALWTLYEEKKVDFTGYRRLRFAKALADVGVETTDEIADEFQKFFQGKNMEAIQVDSALVAMLTAISHPYKIGIITNGPADMSYTKVKRLGLADLFPVENVLISEQLGYHKPEPEVYQIALDHFGVAAEHTLFVGDSWLNDVAGPIASGMQAVWLQRNGQQPSTDHQPLAVIQHIEELMGVLEKVNVSV